MAAATPKASPHRPWRLASGLLSLLVLTSGCLLGSPSPTPSLAASPTVSVSTPKASASGTPHASVAASPRALGPGVYAKVLVDGLRVRLSPRAKSTPVGALFTGDVVLIKSGVTQADGYSWYQVDAVQTANGGSLSGYIAGAKGSEQYLQAMAGPPSPTPSPTARPSASG
jgi:hypothetical protein